jgi:hypothetical protein
MGIDGGRALVQEGWLKKCTLLLQEEEEEKKKGEGK